MFQIITATWFGQTPMASVIEVSLRTETYNMSKSVTEFVTVKLTVKYFFERKIL